MTTVQNETTRIPLHMRRGENGVDPVARLASFRETGEIPVVTTTFGIEAYLVTRYEDVRAVFGDAAAFGNTADLRRRHDGVMPEVSDEEAARMRAGNLLVRDPPDHTRLRRMLTREFTQARIKRLQPRVAEIVDEHLDAMEQAGPPADLVSAFALPIPSLVICELLGVPYGDRAEFQARSNRLLDLSRDPEDRLAAGRENRDYMSELVTAARKAPGDDIIGALIRDHGGRQPAGWGERSGRQPAEPAGWGERSNELGHDELVGIAGLLLIAGHETTSNMLGLGTLALLRRPEQAALVRDDDAMARPAVEELLRWLSVVHSGVPRLATRDTEIRGTRIPKDSLVVCSLPAANRDAGQLEDPDRLDVRRGAAGHVAFGHGVHHCLGAPLARMEMETAFPTLLRRFPTRAVAVADDDVAYRSFHFIYGLSALPVTW